MDRGVTVKPDWFRTPHFGYWAAILSGLGTLAVTYCYPEIAVTSLGPISPISRYLIEEKPGLLKAIVYGSIAIHLLEGAWVFTKCRKLGLNTWTTIKWTLQTIIIGFASTNIVKAKVNEVANTKRE